MLNIFISVTEFGLGPYFDLSKLGTGKELFQNLFLPRHVLRGRRVVVNKQQLSSGYSFIDKIETSRELQGRKAWEEEYYEELVE